MRLKALVAGVLSFLQKAANLLLDACCSANEKISANQIQFGSYEGVKCLLAASECGWFYNHEPSACVEATSGLVDCKRVPQKHKA